MVATGEVVFTLKEFAEKERGIKTAYALEKALFLKGIYITSTTASRLWKSTQQKIYLETLAMLCCGLNCQPSDLLRYVPAKRKPVSKYT